jgi:hypothetical protein
MTNVGGLSFVAEMENVIRANGKRGLEVLLFYRGLNLELYRQVVRDDVYARVHNKNAGNPVELVDKFVGAIAGDDFFPTTGGEAPQFKSAWLITGDQDLKPGDEIRVVRQDKKVMAYRVESRDSKGQTTEVFTKWELSGIM